MAHGSASEVGAARPAGALAEEAFQDTCARCGDCSSICPSLALTVDRDGYPTLVEDNLCQSCGLCADVCMHGAIQFTDETRQGLQLLLAFDKREVAFV